MADEKSVNVFLSKSFWAPVMTMVVTKAALAMNMGDALSQAEQDAIVGGLTALAIVIVRLVTKRPAHLVKRGEK